MNTFDIFEQFEFPGKNFEDVDPTDYGTLVTLDASIYGAASGRDITEEASKYYLRELLDVQSRLSRDSYAHRFVQAMIDLVSDKAYRSCPDA